MRRSTLLLSLAPALLLAACDVRTKDGDDAQGRKEGGAHISLTSNGANGGSHVSIDSPAFDGSLKIPTLDFAAHMKLEGMRLAPNTKVGRVDVTGNDKEDGGGNGDGRGKVDIAFTNPDPPAKLIAFYRTTAADAGWTVGATTDTTLAATRKDKQLAIAVTPAGDGGSTGTLRISGS